MWSSRNDPLGPLPDATLTIGRRLEWTRRVIASDENTYSSTSSLTGRFERPSPRRTGAPFGTRDPNIWFDSSGSIDGKMRTEIARARSVGAAALPSDEVVGEEHRPDLEYSG